MAGGTIKNYAQISSNLLICALRTVHRLEEVSFQFRARVFVRAL